MKNVCKDVGGKTIVYVGNHKPWSGSTAGPHVDTIIKPMPHWWQVWELSSFLSPDNFSKMSKHFWCYVHYVCYVNFRKMGYSILQVSPVMKNLSYAICEQQRCRSTSAQSDQYLCCLRPRKYNIYSSYIQNFKTPASICCGVWTKALLNICPPTKNGMRGHLPPKGIAGVDVCPSFIFTKIFVKIFSLGKIAFIKAPFFPHDSC